MVLLTLGLLLTSSVIQMLGVGSILPFVMVLSMPESIQSNRWLHALYAALGFTTEPRFMFFLGLCTVAAVVLANVSSALNQWVTVHVWGSIQHRLAVRLLEGYLHAPYVVHLRRSPSELKRNVLDETLGFSGIVKLGLQLVASVSLILCITVLLMVASPILSLLLSAFMGASYGLAYLVVRSRMARIGCERLEANLQRFKTVDEGLSAFKELTVLRRTTWTMRRYAKASIILKATLARKAVLDTLPKYLIEILGFGGMVVVVLYLLASHADVHNTIPLVSVFAFGAYRIAPAMQIAYNSGLGLRFSASAASTIEAELRTTIDSKSSGADQSDAEEPLTFRQGIELSNVSFRFSEDRGFALHDVTLKIPCRAFVGLAGQTGAGKSTLADVILGLLPPETGEVRVDGIPLYAGATGRWQRLLGYVPQDVYLADDTITNNIAFGLPPDEVDASAVREAARRAQVDAFIEEELPEGYRTVVGDRGVRLSGGQRQRIGIARALYHRPEVLVLDEATNMLDGETEARVFSAIEGLAHNITLIVIAHRLATLRRADTIYLIDKGSIMAQGSFSQLLESSRQFKSMAIGLA